jgi:hypothetical protein
VERQKALSLPGGFESTHLSFSHPSGLMRNLGATVGILLGIVRSFFLSCAVRRTPLSPWDTRSPLCVGLLVLDCASFSLGRCLPSTTSVEDGSSLFGSFTGTTPRSDSCNAYASAVRLCAFCGPVFAIDRRAAGLPVLVHAVSRHARVFDHAASRFGSRFYRLRCFTVKQTESARDGIDSLVVV